MKRVYMDRSHWPHWASEAHAAGRALAYLEEAAADYGYPGPVGERIPRVRLHLGYALASDRRAREWHAEGVEEGRPWEGSGRRELSRAVARVDA